MAVAVGAACHAATEKVFSFEACHPVSLKGKGAVLHAWIATAAACTHRIRAAQFTTDFVGRAAELEALHKLLADAASMPGAKCGLILGEPGIGKSRLLAEFARRLDDSARPRHLASGPLSAVRLGRDLLGPLRDHALLRRHPGE